MLGIAFLRKRRIRNAAPPAYLPTNYLRRQWQSWQPGNAYAGISNGRQSRGAASSNRISSEVPTSSVHESRTEADFQTNRLSVRSIMTLPPYNPAPLPSERLIAREGERAGVDTVVEYPESETEREVRREEEMGTLYTIREARRREQREREERRIARRDARARGDWLRLEQLEADSRARARERADSNAINDSNRRPSDTSSVANATASRSQQDSSLLIAELNSLRETNSRNRRVSSVSYAELGVARHDGSRIRADSIDSDHLPLLDSAASIGGHQSRSRATSRASTRDGSRSRSRVSPLRTGADQDRRPSTGESFVSQDEDGRSEFLTPQSSGELPLHPPSYEDDVSVHGGEFGEAPPYSSPVLERNPQFPAPPAQPAPAHVAEPGTVERAVSPQPTDDSAQRRPSLETIPLHRSRGSEPVSTRSGSGEMPPLKLLTTQDSQPPSIEVSSATPISTVASASFGGPSSQR